MPNLQPMQEKACRNLPAAKILVIIDCDLCEIGFLAVGVQVLFTPLKISEATIWSSAPI
jgi:hypothetical protein